MNEQERKLKQGKKELGTLQMMFSRWLKSDVDWAIGIIATKGATGEDDEWDFLRREWIDKLENWVGPFVRRLWDTEYITEKQVRNFGVNAAHTIQIMLHALYKLSRGNKTNE